jgi:hypothetical protein
MVLKLGIRNAGGSEGLILQRRIRLFTDCTI